MTSQFGLRQWQARQRSESENRALDAATRLFAEQAFADVTMASVAKAAQMSTRTLFKCFPTKLELVSAVLERMSDELATAIQPPTAGVGEISDVIGALALAYARLLARPDVVGMFRLIIAEGGRWPELQRAYRERAEAPFIGPLRDWAVQESNLGRLRVSDPVHEFGALFGLVEHHVLMQRLLGASEDQCMPVESAATHASRLWLARFGSAL